MPPFALKIPTEDKTSLQSKSRAPLENQVCYCFATKRFGTNLAVEKWPPGQQKPSPEKGTRLLLPSESPRVTWGGAVPPSGAGDSGSACSAVSQRGGTALGA